MNKQTAIKDYMKSLYWTALKEGQTDSDIEVRYTLGQAKSLAENSFKSGWDARNVGLIEEYTEGSFRQPNRFDLMSNAEKAITLAMYVIEESGASENLTNAVIKLSQARDLIYEHYRLKHKSHEAENLY